MPELIDKQASMRAICDGCFKSRAVDLELRCRGTCNVIDILQRHPTIEAEPVRHGRWDDSYDGITPYCTVCGRTHSCFNRNPDFCPHCGARMDGGADNG